MQSAIPEKTEDKFGKVNKKNPGFWEQKCACIENLYGTGCPKHALLGSLDHQSMVSEACEELHDMLLHVPTGPIHVFKVGKQLPLECHPPFIQPKGMQRNLNAPNGLVIFWIIF